MIYKNKYDWERDFRQRLESFQKRNSSGFPLSIKVGVETDCFHNEHSPYAYQEIYNLLEHNQYDCDFVEHESGPEIIAWVALGTSGLTLAKSVVDLVTAIINARAKGRKRGDKAYGNLRLIVRGYGNKGNIKEEKILEITDGNMVLESEIEKIIITALTDTFHEEIKK